MNRFGKKFYIFSQKWAIINIVILSLVSAIAISQLPNLKSQLTTRTVIDKEPLSAKRYEFFEKIFPSNNSLLIFFKGDFSKEENLCLVERWVQKQNLENPNLLKVNDPLQLRQVQNSTDSLQFPLFFPHACKVGESRPIDFKKLDDTPWKNTFTNDKADNIIIEFLIKDAKKETRYGPIDPKHIENIKKSLDENFGSASFDYFLSGSLGGFYYTHKGITFNNLINFMFLLFIIFLFRLFFGTFKSGLLFATTLLIMGGTLYGLMAIFGGAMNILSGGLFLMVSVSAIEDFVFICSEQLKTNSPVEELPPKLTLPSFFTSFTTIIGFGSLCFTDLKIIRDFGLWASLGAVIEWLLIFYFLPSFLKIFPSLKDNWTNPLKACFKNTFQWLSEKNLPVKILLPLLLVFLLIVFSLNQLEVTDTPSNVFPKENPYKKGLTLLKQSYGWEAPAHILFKNANDRKNNERILHEVQKDSLVKQAETPYALTDYLTKDLPPLRQQLILRTLKHTDSYKRVISLDNHAQARLLLNDTNTKKIQQLAQKIETLCEHGKYCFPTGQLFAYADFFSKTNSVLVESLIVSLLLVFITLMALAFFLKIPQKLPIIVSSFWGPFFMVNIFALLNIPVNLLTCVFAGILVGLTGDSAIYYMFEAKDKRLEEGIKLRGNGSIEIVTIMFLCSLIFQLSYFTSARTLGLLIGFGMIASMFGDLWILKGLMALKERWKNRI